MVDVLDGYKPLLKGFSKAHGSKPTAEALTTVHHFARAGKQALALALMLRPEGATGAQIVLACGAPQLNKMRNLVQRKMFARDMNAGVNEAGHTVYRLTLAPKGEAFIAKAAEKVAEGDQPAPKAKKAKAKSKGKAKADKGKPADAVSGDGVTVATPEAETATSEAPAAAQGEAQA